MGSGLLGLIDGYLDAVPRAAARVETIGPFTLFVREGPGWSYYARPTPGCGPIAAAHVAAVRTRQRELGIPETFEWVAELAPDLNGAAAAAGLFTEALPLLHLPVDRFRRVEPAEGFEVRTISPADDVRLTQAVAAVAFAHPGTGAGSSGEAALREAAAAIDPAVTGVLRERLAAGLTVSMTAVRAGVPVAVGSHQPVGDATEVVGVGVLPAFRRRGLGAAVTSALVEDALARGVRTVFLSAGDEEIARVYERLGFERVGTAGAAEPPSAS